ncbi:hypothetical protein LCGC14_2745550, partial [marine sediment metagenome]
HPTVYQQIFEVIKIGDGQGTDTRFPTLYGINPVFVPELGEIPFGDIDDTSTTVSPVKFGIRMGISQEMIDDNEVGLVDFMSRKTGQQMAILRDQESFKALHTFNMTGAVVDQSLPTHISNKKRGAFYTTGAFTNQQSATAVNWETLLNTAIQQMKDQEITFNNETYKIPVFVDTIIANSVRDISLRKLLRTTTVIQATGMGDTDNGLVTHVAGNNIWNGALNVITTPYMARGQAYLVQGRRGLVFLERKPVSVQQNANWAFDAQETRALTRFMPAVVEERSMFSILLGTA